MRTYRRLDSKVHLNQMDLNLLRALVALVRERSVTRAGQSINLGQPGMSSALKKLRLLLGDPLLVRVGRESHLTPRAQQLSLVIPPLFHEIEQALNQQPTFDPSRDERVFRIATTDYIQVVLLRTLVTYLAIHAPNVSLEMHVSGRASDEALRRGDIDLLVVPPERGPSGPRELLIEDRWVVAAWSGNPAIGESISLEQYSALPHVAYGPGLEDLRGLAEIAVQALGIARHIRVTSESYFLLPFYLLGSSSVALVHERLAKVVAEKWDLRLLDPPFQIPPVRTAMFWNPRNTHDPAHLWLREALLKASKDI